MLHLDHVAITAERLQEGVSAVESALGVAMAPGGRHARMATHNRLLGLGDVYLEVIATDPAAAPPPHPRWFDMDRFSGAPRLTNWIVNCDDLEAEIAASPPGVGRPVAFRRGDLSWRMAVPPDGRLPFDGCFPALIEWQGAAGGAAHPAARLPDAGCRLARLEIVHPRADALRAALAGRLADPRISIEAGPQRALRAQIDTPAGRRCIE